MRATHNEWLFFLQDENATQKFAQILAENLAVPLICGFQGQIGAGKTTLIRALMQALHCPDKIKSPTYTLVEGYNFAEFTIYHFDFYRLNNLTEVNSLGLADYLTDDAILLIEWPERIPELSFYDLYFSFMLPESGRNLTVKSVTLKGQKILQQLREKFTHE